MALECVRGEAVLRGMIRHHLRSNVVGYVALFVAVSGTAVALPATNTVFSDDIVNGEVKSKDISDSNGVRSADVRDDDKQGGGLAAVDLARGSVGSSEIATDGVGSPEVKADAVRGSEIATDGVGSPEIEQDAVRRSEIATDGVGSLEIAENAVGASESEPTASARTRSGSTKSGPTSSTRFMSTNPRK